jgi:hypothetical protein
MIKNKLINIMLLFAVLSNNVVADEVFSKAIYDSKLKTLSLEGILVPFIDEFTGKLTDNKGIFDAQLYEINKLLFKLNPQSIKFKSMFDGENTSGYILYDHKNRSVDIPCFQVNTIATFGDGVEGNAIYYKDVNMKQLNGSYPIFHVKDMTKIDNCTLTPPEPISKAQLKGNLSNANVKIYRVADNGDKTLLYKEQTNSDGLFYEHKDELENDKFYIYEVSGGGIDGTIRAVSKGSWITKDFKVSLASEMAYIYLAKDLKYDFDALNVENRLNEVAKTILSSDISGDGNVNVDDLLVFDYQSNLSAVNSSEFSSEKLEEIISDIYQGDFGYGDDIATSYIGNYIDLTMNSSGMGMKEVVLSNDETKAYIASGEAGLEIVDITNPTNPTKIANFKNDLEGMINHVSGVTLSKDGTKAFMVNRGLQMVIVDVTDPSNPTKISEFDNHPYKIILSKDETKAFIANLGLQIVDITNPKNPIQISKVPIDYAVALSLSNDGTKIYLSGGGLTILDITDATNPVKIGHVNVPDDGYQYYKGPYGIALSQDQTKAFVANWDNGLVVIDITDSTNPTIIGNYDQAIHAKDVRLSNDGTKAFVAGSSGVVYAPGVPGSGTDFFGFVEVIDITDPTTPKKIHRYNTSREMLPEERITLSQEGKRAFVVGYRLKIIDLELFTPISSNSSTK